MPPELQAFDHVHIYVTNRAKAEEWYGEVMGLRRTREFESWATGGGPLTIQNESGTIHLALFERPTQPCRSTVALRVGAADTRPGRFISNGRCLTRLPRRTTMRRCRCIFGIPMTIRTS